MGKPCVTPNADWCRVFADVALIQILCHQLLGWHGRVRPPSLALPNGEIREPGMRCMIHLLLSCGRLMRTHRLLTHEFLAQFKEDQQYEAETEAKHTSIFGSSPEPNGTAEEEEYYARLQNDEWNSPDRGAAYRAEPQTLLLDEQEMKSLEELLSTALAGA